MQQVDACCKNEEFCRRLHVLLVQRALYENFGAGLDTLSAPLNRSLSNDLIRYGWESEDTVRSQVIQGRALVEVSESSVNCAFRDIRKMTQKMDSTVRVNIAVISIHIAVFSRLDNILK